MSWFLQAPGWFWGGLVAAAVVALVRRPPGRRALPRTLPGARVPRSARQQAARGLFAGKLAGLVLLGTALAGPQRTLQSSTVERVGVDVLVLLDCSSSMGQQDARFGKSRLLLAREAVESFAQTEEGARFGLVAFARYPRLLCPLTRDREAFAQRLSSTPTAEPGGDEDRTALGAALAFASRVLEASPARSRAVLLLTDAENNVEEIRPDEAALLCAEAGIPVYAGFVGDAAARAQALGSLAARTRGAAAEVTDAASLTHFLDRVGLRLAPVEVHRDRRETRSLLPACAGLAGCLLVVLFVLERTLFLRFP